jgi:hypothetical protein
MPSPPQLFDHEKTSTIQKSIQAKSAENTPAKADLDLEIPAPLKGRYTNIAHTGITGKKSDPA